MLIFDAEEARDVAALDIPSTFIQTCIISNSAKDAALIKIRGILMDALVHIAPGVCKPQVTADKKGTKQLLAQCQSAICGTLLVASLLCHRRFCKSLTDTGFEVNPRDPCPSVANKIMKGKQMTTVFHVDDCKPSHKNPKEMDNAIKWLSEEHKSIFEEGSGKMSASCGKGHTRLLT